MNRIAKAFIAALALFLAPQSSTAWAVTPDEMLKDPVLEARARDLSKLLRCVVCQNQSIDDSSAPLAQDLRVLVRERLTAGDSNNQVLSYIVTRYGNFVLLKPPFQINTLLLWFGPALLFALAAFGLWRTYRPALVQAAPNVLPELTQDDEKRLAALLGDRPAA